jgi:hypothetical protein
MLTISDRQANSTCAGAYHRLGIDTDTELTDVLGRPLKLCQGTPIQGVLA